MRYKYIDSPIRSQVAYELGEWMDCIGLSERIKKIKIMRMVSRYESLYAKENADYNCKPILNYDFHTPGSKIPEMPIILETESRSENFRITTTKSRDNGGNVNTPIYHPPIIESIAPKVPKVIKADLITEGFRLTVRKDESVDKSNLHSNRSKGDAPEVPMVLKNVLITERFGLTMRESE